MERLWGYVCGGLLRLWFKQNKPFVKYLQEKKAKYMSQGGYYELEFKDVDVHEFDAYFKIIEITIFINSDPTDLDEEERKKREKRQNFRVFSKEELKRIRMLEFMNVKEGFTLEELKKSYRKLTKKHHPDTGGSGDDFIKLQHYYNILSSERTENL